MVQILLKKHCQNPPENVFLNVINLMLLLFSCSVMYDYLWPHELQHARLPCLSSTPRAFSTHVHRVSDAIKPFNPLLSPSPPAFSLSQHQGLFKWVSSSHQVAKVLELQLQHQSFQRIFRTDFLEDGLVGSAYSPRDSQESSATPQFKSIAQHRCICISKSADLKRLST